MEMKNKTKFKMSRDLARTIYQKMENLKQEKQKKAKLFCDKTETNLDKLYSETEKLFEKFGERADSRFQKQLRETAIGYMDTTIILNIIPIINQAHKIKKSMEYFYKNCKSTSEVFKLIEDFKLKINELERRITDGKKSLYTESPERWNDSTINCYAIPLIVEMQTQIRNMVEILQTHLKQEE